MLRFVAACVVIAAVCVGAVLLLAKGVPEAVPSWIAVEVKDDHHKDAKPRDGDGKGGEVNAKISTDVSSAPKAQQADDDRRVSVKILSNKTSAQPLIFQDARILATQ